MKTCVSGLLVALTLALAPHGVARAQGNQGGGAKAQSGQSKPSNQGQHQQSEGPQQRHKPQTAQVGAGTDHETTTGNSGPKKGGGGGKPPLPQAKLCDSYQNAVRQDCLDTVLRKQAAQAGQGQQPGTGANPKSPSTSGG